MHASIHINTYTEFEKRIQVWKQGENSGITSWLCLICRLKSKDFFLAVNSKLYSLHSLCTQYESLLGTKKPKLDNSMTCRKTRTKVWKHARKTVCFGSTRAENYTQNCFLQFDASIWNVYPKQITDGFENKVY